MLRSSICSSVMDKLFAEQSFNVARDVFRHFRALGALFSFVRAASLRSRAGEGRKPLAIAAAVSNPG